MIIVYVRCEDLHTVADLVRVVTSLVMANEYSLDISKEATAVVCIMYVSAAKASRDV